MNSAVIKSKISFIDGARGILRYRGYPIEVLAEKSNFLESSYLLLYGELPTRDQFKLFETEVMHHTMLHRDLEGIVGSFRHDSHPMYVDFGVPAGYDNTMLISSVRLSGRF